MEGAKQPLYHSRESVLKSLAVEFSFSQFFLFATAKIFANQPAFC